MQTIGAGKKFPKPPFPLLRFADRINRRVQQFLLASELIPVRWALTVDCWTRGACRGSSKHADGPDRSALDPGHALTSKDSLLGLS